MQPVPPWLSHYPPDIDWDAELPVRPLTTLMDDAVRQFPRHACLDFYGFTLTFAEMRNYARNFAASLQAIGIKKGDRIGLFLPNCPQYVIAYYGILYAGATVVNFNPLYAAAEIEHHLRDAGCAVMVTLALKALYPKLSPFLENGIIRTLIVCDMADALPLFKSLAYRMLKRDEIVAVPRDERHRSFRRMMKKRGELSAPAIDPQEDVAVLQYTGGTTGVPKAAMLTHANLYANTLQAGYWFAGLVPGKERMMGVLPFFHVFAMTAVMNIALHKGATIIMHPRFELKALLEDIQKKKPTLMPGVPTMFAAINNSRSLEQYDLTSIKLCISGGAPLPREVKEKFESLTRCKLVEGYGLSESSPIAAVNPLFGVNKPGSIGMPLPGTIIEVIDKEDHVTEMKQGEIGEICIRGPQVMKGYWNMPDETENALRRGRLHTGDLGYMDEEGYFFIVDRLKEMIISGGYNIYPRNVEEAIYTHPDIVEAAVVGVNHPQRGQAVKAFVVKKDGATLDEVGLKIFLKDKLAPFAVPAKIEFRNSLPKTPIGKISKKELLG